MRAVFFLFLACTLASLALQPLRAVDFEKQVLPIFEAHCVECHGEEKQKNKLRLDSVLGIVKGGESGEPLLLPGNARESHVLKRVLASAPKEKMPPTGERLSEEEVAVLRSWIDAGAVMPGAAEAAASLKIRTDHWSFRPVQKVGPPKHEHPFATGPLDGFVFEKLQEKGLLPSPEADRATLIRRLYLVMHGMPPAPEEVRLFVEDKVPGAYERLVDRVLASPRYGERWARHWMDVVRYADTDGFERNKERKSAYPYRDYLIEALNADKPYDLFIKEQVAGDTLGVDAATGFLVAGPYDSVKSSDKNLTLMQRQDELADIVNTTGTAFLGLTMGCARCHNHKFDPILQKDYYAMQAVFAGVLAGERPLREKLNEAAEAEIRRLKEQEAGLVRELKVLREKGEQMVVEVAPGRLRPPVNARQNSEEFEPVEAKFIRFTILATLGGGQPCLDELEVFNERGENVALSSLGVKATASGTLPGYAIHKLEHINDGKFGNEWSWISDAKNTGWVQLEFPAQTKVQRVVWGRARDGRNSDRVPTQYKIEAGISLEKWALVASSETRMPLKGGAETDEFLARLPEQDAARARELKASVTGLQARVKELQQWAWVGRFDATPRPTRRLYRGEPTQEREIVAPDSLSVVSSLGLSVNDTDQTRRQRFADWVASPSNPLTARVMVNRLWHYIFGAGIVDTPSDFGLNGGRPTHPELLDWLASELMENRWSLKHVQRLILLSSTFRQSSAPSPKAMAVDADARFLWRYPPRRLEAEAIRDSILSVAGTLDLKMGGPGFYLLDVVNENVNHYFPKEKYGPDDFRRMVYLFRVRAAQDGVFGSFDCPDGGSVMARRSRSNTPLQALNLFNSSFTTQQGEALAQRLQSEAGPLPERQVERAFLLLFARTPDAFELSSSVALIREHGLLSFARALLNTSEFLFVL